MLRKWPIIGPFTDEEQINNRNLTLKKLNCCIIKKEAPLKGVR
jgi:hypothetical protein